MLELIIAVFLGSVGGMGRAFQSGRLVKPGRGHDERGNPTYELGFLRLLGVGAVAGLLAWFLNGNASFVDHDIDIRPLASALLAGIAGDIVFDYYTGQRYGATGSQERQDTCGVKGEVAATANATSREAERAREERRELQQRVAELEAENERLRKSDTLDN